MATILIKKSDTASSVPLAADLTNAAGGVELAVNTVDKKIYTKTAGGTVVELTGLKSSDIGTSVQAYDAQLSTLAGASADRATFLASDQAFSMRNRIINGDMRIDQRNAGALISSPANQQFLVDRWQYEASQTGKVNIQQNYGSVTPPVGYKNYLGVVSNSAYSVVSSDTFDIRQRIEGYNVVDLAWGTANAQAITVSFWVRSSLTGTFTGAIQNSAQSRSYPFTYTINSANTWEQKTVNIAGDQSGTWLTDNGVGLTLVFNFGVGATYAGTAGAWASALYYGATGQTSVVGTSGATFYITGVQLEAGSVASPFERRDYGRELMMCQRYMEKSFPIGTATADAAGLAGAITAEQFASGHNYLRFKVVQFAVEKRANPTITFYNPNTASTTPSGLKAGEEGANTSINAGMEVRTNYTSTRAFYPLLNPSVQGTNNQFQVWATQWKAECEL